MHRMNVRLALAALMALTVPIAGAWAQAYDPPTGGWTYIYTGDLAMPGGGFTALDGTWSHDNGSDQWDESEIGTGNPGGVTGGLTDGDTVYVRLQETGDPPDYGMPDPSNRKVYFGHDISAEGASESILDDGVTLSFRSRVSTGDPLDPQHPDGGDGMVPWPEDGIGYNLHDGGKSTFTIKQASGGSVSFAMAAPSSEGTATPGLVTNNLNGDANSGAVDGLDDVGRFNFLPVHDHTEWHEFWVTIEGNGDDDGTHRVQIWRDGTAMPAAFDVTAGSGSDYGDISYIALGLGATPRRGAIDVDFFAWAPGVILPAEIPEPGDFNLDGSVTTEDYFILNENLFGHLTDDVLFESGDIDVDGDVDLDDFGQFKAVFPAVVAQAQGIPEPATLVLLLIAAVGYAGMAWRRRIGGHLGVGMVALCALATLQLPAAAQVNVEWAADVGNYDEGSNWSTGFTPDDAIASEVAVISNGGTAFVESAVLPQPGGILLGQDEGEAGTLEIRSGGELTVVDGANTNGQVLVGVDGQGTFRVLRGGTFNGDELFSGGASDSLIEFGQVDGSGTATIDLGANATLARTTRVIGPDVDFSLSALTLTSEHNLVSEITGPTHSTINAEGRASLAGTLTVEFNDYTPALGDRWALIQSPRVQGAFASIDSDFATGPGTGLFVDTQPDGMGGQIAELVYEARLQLSIDPNTGAAALQNLTASESFDIDAYEVISLGGGLMPGSWTSMADADNAWREAGSDTNRLGETNLMSSMVLGPESSISLGNIFDPPGENGSLDGISFLYHEAGGRSVAGLVALAELMMGGGPLDGDYNNNNRVEQADLDLVLLNWGQSFDTLPDDWINQRPTEGIIDQAELDGVLLNWGNAAGAALAAASVPEPSSCTLVAMAGVVSLCIRRRRSCRRVGRPATC